MQNLSTAIDWDDLRFFSAVSGYGTISAAAKKLHVNHVTVSRHINKLEEALGIRLFDRLNDGYRLTTDGKAIYKRVQSVKLHIDNMLLLNPKYLSLTGTVVISGTRNLVDCFLSEKMKNFYDNYPEINIVFITENRNLSIVKRETDISLRINRPKEGCFKIRKLVDMNYFLYANDSLIQKYKKEGLYNLRYINFTDDLCKLAEYIYGYVIIFRDRIYACSLTRSTVICRL